MRAIWKGAISFGLVSVPIGLYAATKSEEVKFRLLRATDLSPIKYKRVAELDGHDVPWEQVVKGYEYEKDRFVVLTEEDFKRVDIAATQTIDLLDFVDLAEINPVHFFRPYYLEPQRGGASAYALLRDVLAETGKAGIAKIVLKSRQHLAALKPNGDALVLELMHFAHELVDAHALKLPGETKPGRRELDMAATLVAQMTVPWDAQRYQDDYTAALLTMIDRKVAAGGKELPTAKDAPRPATNVVDLVTALQQSLDRAGAGKAPRRAAAPRPKPERAPPRRAGRRTKASSAAA